MAREDSVDVQGLLARFRDRAHDGVHDRRKFFLLLRKRLFAHGRAEALCEIVHGFEIFDLLPGFVVEALDHSGVSPERICFEVNEGAVTSNVQYAQRFIEVLHGIGCEFALDDFGSGLGAFSNLKNLPVDYLKIDGSYTRNLASDQVNQEMVSAMIKLARTMEFRVVAEQVEQQEDFDWLREVGVDFVQGNFIEAPTALGSAATGRFRSR